MKTLKQRLEENQEPQKAINNTIKSHEKFYTRIRKRVKRIIQQEHSYFMTFTLKDQALDLHQRTHIKKITETLASLSVIDYVLNNDYGDKNNRLHYHCVACFSFQLDYTTFYETYKYGAVNCRAIIKKDLKSITEYLLKLTNHALKKTSAKIWRKRLPKYPKIEGLKELLYEDTSRDTDSEEN